MEAKDTSYRKLTTEELSTTLARRNSGLNSARGNPLSEDFALRDVDTILVATDPQFDINGNGSYLNAVVNTKKFVEAGGTLVATGKSTAFPSLLGGVGSPRFYSFTGLPRPYGNSTTITDTKVLSPRIIEAMGGTNQFIMQSSLPHSQHSIIESWGRATPLASTIYVFEDIEYGPWGPEFVTRRVTAFNTIEYEQGSKSGKVIYMHGELDANYNAGGLSRAFVDALLDPVIYRADDNEEIASDIGGTFYENPDAKPIGSNSMNLNMVVYKGGIELNNSEINKDISLVFTITDRYAPNSLAPQIDSSGEPALVLSLYKPNGQLYKTCSTISGDSTVSIGVPAAQNTSVGNWKYVVNGVHGFDGNRVVLMAAVDGLYNMNAEAWAEFLDSISDDIDPEYPPTSDDVTSYDIIWRGKKSASSFNAPAMLPAAPVYPRGIVNGTFYHQLGDRRNTVSRSSVEKISFGPLVKSKDVNIWRTDDDLVLDIKGTTERVTVPGWFADNGKVSGVAFADGSALSASEVASRAVDHEPEIDITPVSIDNRITGTDGNDNLSNNGKDAKILGGKGDDTITATGGDNVFYYRMGDGNDTLVVTSGADNVNILRFHTDIASTDVTAKREGDDMKLAIGNGSVTIRGWYANAASKIDRVEFFGGTVFDDRDLERMASGKPMVERVYYIAGDDADEDTQKGDTTTKQSDGGGSGSSGCNAGVLPLLAILGFATLIAKKRRMK